VKVELVDKKRKKQYFKSDLTEENEKGEKGSYALKNLRDSILIDRPHPDCAGG